MTEGNVDFNKEHILAIVMGNREAPVLEAILPSYIVVRNPPPAPPAPPLYHESVLLLISPHQSRNSVTVAGVNLVDRWSWKHTVSCMHHLSGEEGRIV